MSPRRRRAHAAGAIAATLATTSAALSLHRALGGSWLLSTVGGDLERLTRTGGPVAVAGGAAAAAKLVATALPLALLGRPRRIVRLVSALGRGCWWSTAAC
ncbi:hypothetical protein RDV89_17250 [Nocardioides zeae]|uniref:Uncharacterized protein n=1 Tax=Nocardioides imazamoxiresistens TaxID=3231893 RepID=A0ABU3PZZ4_9ACTN|nr:hypothetical protein [Nocardioides zeae]MDT9594838.1 hypothetical protein [Nocardioides zeae]